MIEFAVLAAFLVPTFLWTFVTAMDLIRMIEAIQVCRDVGSIYMRGTDYSLYIPQQIASTLAGGLGLQVGSSFPGNDPSNDANGGNGWVVLSELMYVGANACSAVPAGDCTNEGQYVYLQRIDFGNSGIQFSGTTVQSAVGSPILTMNSSGMVQNYLTDPNAAAPNFANLVQAQLADQQIVYVVETFFASPDLGFSALPGGGIYSRNFF